MNPNDWQEILRAAHQEPIDPAHYTALRARVLAGIASARPSPWRRFAWLSGLAASAAAILLAVALRRPDVPPPPLVALTIPPAIVHTRVPAPRTPPRLHARRIAPPHREPLTVKLQTSDPNIVIYWIAE